MSIPFLDLHAQYMSIKDEIDSAISRVIASGHFVGGEEVTNFESEFAGYIGVDHCIAVNSGTDALILGFRALGFKPGDEVIVPVNTFIATALGASENGLKPVFVDCDADYGMSLTDLAAKITDKTRAVIPVHLYGQPDQLDEIKSVIRASGKDIKLVEDACQAHGAEYKGKKVGSFGVFSAFSFYPGKNLGAYGDGGAVTTNDPDLANKIRLLREYGSPKKYFHESLGVNSRMDAMQAAILRTKLPHLDAWNKVRGQIADTYRKNIFDKNVVTPKDIAGRHSVNHVFVIRHPKRDDLQNSLLSNGIQTLIHYPLPLHRQNAYRPLGYKIGDFPIAERFAKEILSLPIYPEISGDDLSSCIEFIDSYR